MFQQCCVDLKKEREKVAKEAALKKKVEEEKKQKEAKMKNADVSAFTDDTQGILDNVLMNNPKAKRRPPRASADGSKRSAAKRGMLTRQESRLGFAPP